MPSDDARTTRSRPRLPRLPWRRGSAWLLGIIFGTQSVLFYGAVTWLPSLLAERGWSATDAAGQVALFTGIQLVATIAVPAFADRLGSRRQQLAAAGSPCSGQQRRSHTASLAPAHLQAAHWSAQPAHWFAGVHMPGVESPPPSVQSLSCTAAALQLIACACEGPSSVQSPSRFARQSMSHAALSRHGSISAVTTQRV